MARYDRPHLAAFIAVAIDLLDALDPDPEAEDSETDEAVGDEADAAWTEWQTRGRHKLARGKSEPFSHEDAEDDDNDSGVDDGGEAVEEREPEDYEGGHSEAGIHNPMGITA